MASTTYEQHQLKKPFLVGIIAHFANNSVFYSYLAAIGNMVRNAGQLPQPFWLGAACGGGSCGFPASVARA